MFYTVKVQFPYSAKKYTYKVDYLDVDVNDKVVVKTSSGLTVVTVVAIDDEPDLEEGINYKYIVDRVDPDLYESLTGEKI